MVDFSDQGGWPRWFGAGLERWLRKFHVAPRPNLEDVLTGVAQDIGGTARHTHLYRRYAQYGVIEKPSRR